jgi:putative ABC transport system permease protein
METLWQDVRYGARMLLRSPGFTLVAVLTLALGIGANTAIFTVVNAVLLRPLPYPQPDRLVLLTEHWARFPVLSVSYENYKDWRDQSHSFELVGAARNANLTLTGAGDPDRLQGQVVSASFFDLLGVKPVIGRVILSADDRPDSAPVAMLSYGLWQRRFGGAADVLGRSVTLDNNPYTVIGVLPPGFEFLLPADVLVAMEPWAKTLPDDRSWHPGIQPIARLRPGVTLEQARSEMALIAKRLEQQYPLYDTGVGANVNLLHDQIVQNARPALLVLLAAVALVLLIACVNVANLLLSRATNREKEIAIRAALGAGRARVIRQLLTESVLLGLAGGALAVAFAFGGLAPLLKLAGTSLPGTINIRIDLPVLAFTAGLSLLTGILFGLAPALQSTRMDLREELNQNTRGTTGGAGRSYVCRALVISEVALAMILLVGAGLLIQSFLRLSTVAPGFSPDHLLLADVPLSPTVYTKPEQRTAFFDQLLERAQTLPGVRVAGSTTFVPVSGTGGVVHFNIAGRPPKGPHDFIMAGFRYVSPQYLPALGVPLLQGRGLATQDSADSPPVAVINEAMATQFFPGESPLGRKLQLGALPDSGAPLMEIVGVVGNVKYALGSEPQAEMYLPYTQASIPVLPVLTMTVVLRAAGEPQTLVSALREAVHEINSDQPIIKIRTMEQNMGDSVAAPRFRTALLAVLAGLALFLSVIGVYGVMAYSVSQRTHEIGVRMALGAPARDVLRLVLGQGLRLALIGVAIGGAASLVLSRVMTTFLYGVTATDPLTYFAVAALLTAISLAACYVPARRATEVDPIRALHYE